MLLCEEQISPLHIFVLNEEVGLSFRSMEDDFKVPFRSDFKVPFHSPRMEVLRVRLFILPVVITQVSRAKQERAGRGFPAAEQNGLICFHPEARETEFHTLSLSMG